MNDTELRFVNAFETLAHEAADNAVKHGFTDASFPERLVLMHAELSEALEAYRDYDKPSEHIPAFSSIEEELADVIIRIMDESAQSGRRLAEAIVAKMKFNESRPFKHGGKRI